MRGVEVFSGCGGLALGTARAGFRHARMVEWNADACATLALNRANKVEHVSDWPFIHSDVRNIDWTEIDDVDLVAGGPPCQPFSIGGKHAGKEDARDMWPEAVRAIRELEPAGFLFENVRGLTRPAFADYLAWIKASLAVPQLKRWEDEDHLSHLARLRDCMPKAWYDVELIRVNAADFGAAQKRHRVVIVGVRRDLRLALPALKPTHSHERLLWDQWISGEYWERHGLPRLAETPRNSAELGSVSRLRAEGRRPGELPWRTVRDALAGLGEPTGENCHVFQAGARIYKGHTGSLLDEPAKALKAGDHGVPGGENMMVRDDGSVRYFSIREAARLQGLPDNWVFATSWSESMRQLGNAVPVELSYALGLWIANMLRGSRMESRAA